MMYRIASVCAVVVLTLLAGCADASEESSNYADDMAEQHEGDSPQATAAAREPSIPVDTSTVAYATAGGSQTTGYLAAPANPDSILEARGMESTASLPGLVVIHEWWGLNDNIRTATRRLAGEGYRALAVDLYNGGVAATPDSARALMSQATQDMDQVLGNLRQAHQYLVEEGNAPKVGVLGWCFGGGMSLNAALAQPDSLDAAVIYYGRISEAGEDQLAQLQMPVMGFFGAEDGGIPVEGVRQFEQTLSALGKTAHIYIYPNAGHAFANPSGERFAPEAADDAWDKTTAFLKKHLYDMPDITIPDSISLGTPDSMSTASAAP